LALLASTQWSLLKQRSYGDTILSIFVKSSDHPKGDPDDAPDA